jgi:hypothetical protein
MLTHDAFLSFCPLCLQQIQAGVRNWPGGGCNVTAADAIQIAGAVGVAKSQVGFRYWFTAPAVCHVLICDSTLGEHLVYYSTWPHARGKHGLCEGEG